MLMNILQLIVYVQAKYLRCFDLLGIDKEDESNVMVANYNRLGDIWVEIVDKQLSPEEATELYLEEVSKLHSAIKHREFVCKVSNVAYLDSTTILAKFWGSYYVIMNFAEHADKLSKLETLLNPEVFSKCTPLEYHVYFGDNMEIDVSSDFIWHYGKRLKEGVVEDAYEWVSRP